MSDELKHGDFVFIAGKEPKPLEYMVICHEGLPVNVGGMVLVARWYRAEALTKVARPKKAMKK
jgi:hypothetical protein